MRSGVVCAIVGAVLGPLAAVAPAGTPVVADYVEARTASVFAGACHYNGEVVTTGRDAVLAWKVTSGAWRGTDLAGVRAIAVVSSDESLAERRAPRRADLVVDAATDAQADAFIAVLRASSGDALGEIVRVRRLPIAFEHEGKTYRVAADRFAALAVEGMPNDECCKMPNLVWYEPLVTVVGRKVGYTGRAYYAGGAAGGMWERGDENSAFYGRATLDE
jgi:uncharacterized protein DUF1326